MTLWECEAQKGLLFGPFWYESGYGFNDFDLKVLKWIWILQKQVWILELKPGPKMGNKKLHTAVNYFGLK